MMSKAGPSCGHTRADVVDGQTLMEPAQAWAGVCLGLCQVCVCVLYGGGGECVWWDFFWQLVQRNHVMFFFLEEERGVCVGRPKCVLGL